jgi:hypothetical protein
VQKSERVIIKLINQLDYKHVINNQRREHWNSMFGSYIERDGSGTVHTVKEIKNCPDFLKEIDEVSSFVNY